MEHVTRNKPAIELMCCDYTVEVIGIKNTPESQATQVFSLIEPNSVQTKRERHVPGFAPVPPYFSLIPTTNSVYDLIS